MDEPDEKPPFAWQPLTRRGVAAFARAALGRLLLVQFLAALLAAATVVWLVQTGWFPVIDEAVTRLPAGGELRSGVLEWPGESPASLADGHFLAVLVDLEHEGAARSPAHVQVEFGRKDLKVISLLGWVTMPYPFDWVVSLNRSEREPWWGAWKPAILAMIAAGVMFGLMLSWALLATICFLPVWLGGLLANRDLSLSGSWRLAGAALMPGSLFLTAVLFIYGLGALDLIHLAIAWAVHLLIGWAYLLAALLSLPRHPEAAPGAANPFAAETSSNPPSNSPAPNLASRPRK
jgi:hypothetical protein